MAKAKKTKDVLLEEMLVPVDEQPYEVPENWCWIRLLDAFDNLTDSKKKLATKEYLEEGMYPVVDQGQEFIGGYTDAEDMLYEGGLPVVVFGDHTRCMKYIDFPFVQGADGVKVLRPKSFWDSKAFYYAFKSVEIPNLGYRRHYPLLKDFCIPVPPLTEQQRIVEQIESLFVKLDEAKEKAQNVIDNYDTTVFAILHKAFIGELSAKWRVNNGINKDSWRVKKINEICMPRAGYAFDSKKFQSSGCQIIRMGNLYGGVLDLSRSPVYMDESEIDEGIVKRAKIHDGDILITLTGTKYKRDYGYAVCIEKSENLYVNQRILCLTPNDDIDRDYLLYYLRSNIFRDVFFSNETGGVNQGNVSSKFVENIELQVPSLREQQVIAAMLKDILTKEELAKELAESVVQQIDLLKKSILAKAFRGELGTNNPDEENVIKSLKYILEQEG